MRVLICVVLSVFMVMMSVEQADAVLSYYPMAWNGANAFLDASNNLWTAIQAASSGCVYYCGRAWSAATVAGAQAARILSIGMYYGALVGLSGVSVYMAYKGFEYVNGVLRVPTGEMGVASGAPGVGSYSTAMYAIQVQQTLAAANAKMTSMGCSIGTAVACGTCVYQAPPGDWHCSSTGAAGWDCSIWGNVVSSVQCSGKYQYVMYPLNGHTEYVAPVKTPQTLEQSIAAVGADIAGTNGSEAQNKAKAALLASVGVLSDPYNKWKNGTLPTALPSPYNTIPESGWQSIADTLTGGMSQTVKDNIAAQDVAENAFKDVVNPPASGTITKADMADAVEDGVKAADEELVVPGDVALGDPGSVEAPAKDAIGGKLDTYWTAINNIPVLNLLTSLTLSGTGAGSPTIQVAIPSIFASEGATYTISFDEEGLFGVNYGNYLELLGNLMLAFAGIVWTKYLFEG